MGEAFQVCRVCGKRRALRFMKAMDKRGYSPFVKDVIGGVDVWLHGPLGAREKLSLRRVVRPGDWVCEQHTIGSMGDVVEGQVRKEEEPAPEQMRLI